MTAAGNKVFGLKHRSSENRGLFRQPVQTPHHLRRIQSVAEHVVGLPQVNLAVFRGGRACDFGAGGECFGTAYHGGVVVGDDDDVGFGRYPCLARHRLEAVNGGCGVDAAGAADDFVGGGVFTRNDAAVVAEQVSFAVGGLLFHVRLPFRGDFVRLRAFADELPDAADALRVGGDAVVGRDVDGVDTGCFQAGENVGRLCHPRTDGDVGLGGDNGLDGQAAVDADAGFALQDGILHGLVAADDFVQRTECGDDVRRIGRQHDDALRVGGGCKGDEGGENEVFGFHRISFEGFRRP